MPWLVMNPRVLHLYSIDYLYISYNYNVQHEIYNDRLHLFDVLFSDGDEMGRSR